MYRLYLGCMCAFIFYSTFFFPSENWMDDIQFDYTRTFGDTKMYEHFCWAIVSMKWLLSGLPLLLLLLYHRWISWLGCQKGNYFSWPKGTNSTNQPSIRSDNVLQMDLSLIFFSYHCPTGQSIGSVCVWSVSVCAGYLRTAMLSTFFFIVLYSYII